MQVAIATDALIAIKANLAELGEKLMAPVSANSLLMEIHLASINMGTRHLKDEKLRVDH